MYKPNHALAPYIIIVREWKQGWVREKKNNKVPIGFSLSKLNLEVFLLLSSRFSLSVGWIADCCVCVLSLSFLLFYTHLVRDFVSCLLYIAGGTDRKRET